jgi:hypothetical protein
MKDAKEKNLSILYPHSNIYNILCYTRLKVQLFSLHLYVYNV